MFIELSEMLRCPSNHEECHVVVATTDMQERSVRQGVVGCPSCHAEYVIHDGVVRFGDPAEPPAVELPDPAHLHTFLGIDGPGGFVRRRGQGALLVGLRVVGEIRECPIIEQSSDRTLPRRDANSLLPSQS